MAKVKISELPSLSPATLDTTYVVGISGSTTYKISINQLTSSLDTTFATDLVTTALSSSLNSKLSTSSFNTFTQSYYSTSASVDSRLDTLENFSSSADNRYVLSGSITQTTWDNIANKPNDIVSSSTQISALGFVTGSYTTLNSFNNLTQSFNSISQSFTSISGSFGSIDFSGINAVTESYLLFTQSYYSASASVDNRITNEKNRIDAILSASNANTDTFAEVVSLINSVDLTNDNAFATFYTASNGRITSLENATSSYLTSLNGAISSSTQVLNGSGIYSSSAQLPTNIISSSTQITSLGFISTSVSLTGLNTISASYLTFTQSYYSASASFDERIINAQPIGYLTTSSYQTDSASFNSRIISGSAVVGTISSSAQITALGFISTSTQIPTGTISGSSQISTFGFITGSYISSSTYTTDSSSFNNRIISGSAVAGTISGSAQISALGYATTSSVTTISASAWGAFQSASSYSGSFYTTINTNIGNITTNSASAWGAFQSASSYSSSLQTSIATLSSSVDSRLDNQEAFSSSISAVANSTTKILDAFYTSATAWSGSYTGNGGTVKVEANFTMYTTSTGTKTFTLYRDGVAVDSGSFFFNQANTHTVMPTLYYVGTNETGTHTYSVGHNAISDVNDTCNIVVTETYNTLTTIGALNADYIQVQKSVNQTGVTKNSDITFDVVTSTNSGITHSNGVFTLTANKTYVLEASLDVTTFSSAAAYLWWSWVDATTNVQLDTSNGGVLATGASGVAIPATWGSNDNYVSNAKLIYTPATNQTIKLRATDGGGTCVIYSIASRATITQINPSFATNALSTMQISGSLIATGSITTKGNINIGTGSANEGGEIDLAYAQNTTLTGSNVAIDVYQDKVRIFENGGTNRGVSIDLSKAPASVGGDLLWKTSGYVNAGTFLTLDNLKVTCTTGGNRGLSIGAVSTNFTANVSGNYGMAGPAAGGAAAYNVAYTTSAATSAFGWSFGNIGDTSTYIINDTTNSRVYRVILMIGASFNNNFISIERLH